MPIFDQLQRASFDGLEFPVRAVQIRGQYRHFDHVYLRVPGAVIEKLERDPYTFEMDALFSSTIKGYGDLWPGGIAAMRSKFERGLTAPLTIPTIGTVPALITNWDQSADMGKMRSGESVKITFKEDQSETNLTLAIAEVDQTSLANSADRLGRVVQGAFMEYPEDASLFDKIQDAANAVLAIKDQAGLYGGLVSAKVAQLTSYISQADQMAQSLRDPQRHELLDALLELWDAAVTLGKNLAEGPRGPRIYVVPRTMSVSDIAAATQDLGGTDDANTIMLNNYLEDPFQVEAGAQILYFAQ